MSSGGDARSDLAAIAHEARLLLGIAGKSRWAGIEIFSEASSPDREASGKADVPSPAPTPPGSPAARARRAPAGRAEAPAPAPARPAAPIPPGLDTLEAVAAAVASCTRCPLHETRTNTVPGEGNPSARLMFVGEAPGADEDAQGRPFVGRAGQLLTGMIEKGMGLSRGEVFIANVLKCRPPGNRDPQPEEAAACLPFLRAQLAIVRPEVVCALGRHAVHALLDTKAPIGRLRGRFQQYEGIPLMPTFHPSYLLRSPGDKKVAWEDLKLILARLGLPVPGARPGEGRT